MKNSSDTIGNRTRDIPACSTVPQPTASPRASVQRGTVLNTVGNCDTAGSVIKLYCNIMGPPSYVRSVVDRNVVMRHIAVM
jgi:hypothetical protein